MDQPIDPPLARSASDAAIAGRTDVYFTRTRTIVQRFGDCQVTYAVFLRRPVVSAARLMLDWLESVARDRGTQFDIELMHPEGTWVGAGDPIRWLRRHRNEETTGDELE